MDTAKVCDKGGREENQDYAIGVLVGNGGCFVVADGLGGHRGGERASQAAAEAVFEAFEAQPEANVRAVEQSFVLAQKAVAREAVFAKMDGMRTTLAMLLIQNGTAVWGHMGDSRVYHIRNNEILTVTEDHSVAYLSYKEGEIAYEEIRNSPDQNRLIRSIGAEPKGKPDISAVTQIQQGDCFLLCSDGFWELLTDQEMINARKKTKTASRWLARMVRMAEKRAQKVPDNDNYSAVVVEI